jgi:hypothetical protein
VDVVLTKRFKKSSVPEIELRRKEHSATLICRGEERDSTPVAVVWKLGVPVLGPGYAIAVIDFIKERYLK